ncbi:MAG: GntR family transcriptional regulator [Paenibacillus sp.]|uniref:extracellular solute-binding protein n=1 Tax=Paenibacillus sp. GCM10012303 TaxID=3317340 RepID=UPI0029F3901E|nr:GntR family transcriptional regulator [Paenibacillus sp.]
MQDQAGRKHFRQRMDLMVRTIREDISAGRLRHGDFLPSEKAYAKQYALSNKSVRQGLDVLVAERLLEKIPRVGNRVIGTAAAGQAVLRFGYYPSMLEQAALESLIEQFHARHPDIRVQMIPMTAPQTFGGLRTYVDTDALDLISISSSAFDEFVTNDGADYWETVDTNPHIYPFLNETLQADGQLKAQPFIFSPLMLIYNKSHLRSLDLLEPDSGWRWGDLFGHASKLNVEKERIGFYFHFPSFNRWPVFLLQSGMTFGRETDGTMKLRGTPLADGLRTCQELITTQNRFPLMLSDKEADAEKLFFDGKVSMLMTSYFSLNMHPHNPKIKYDIAPLPYVNESKTLLLVIGLAISSRSQHKDNAKLLLDFLISYRSQLTIRQTTLSIPSLKPAAEWTGKETMYRPSRFHMYREIIPTFAQQKDLRLSKSELGLIQREARLYWSGLEAEDVFLDRLEKLLSHPGQNADGSA